MHHRTIGRLAAIVATSFLPAADVAVGAPRTYYATDFQGTVGPEWVPNGRTATTPLGGRKFLGQFGAEAVTLTVTGIPLHGHVTVRFDLFIIGSWDGNYVSPTAGPDIFDLSAGGGTTVLHTTFNTHDFAAQYQAYPDAYPGGQYPSHTGAVEVGTLGYSCVGSCRDAVYHLDLTFDHAAPSLTLTFSKSNPESIANESWGIDNVTVLIAGTPCDFDRDWDVDLEDFVGFQICFNGPNRPPGAYCPVDADLDDDNDVDLEDFMVFARCFNGPNTSPACLPPE